MQANNNTNPAPLAAVAAPAAPADLQASIAALLHALPNTDSGTPAQQAAERGLHATQPGQRAALAGTPVLGTDTSKPWAYATSGVYGGRRYRGNLGGLYLALRGLAANPGTAYNYKALLPVVTATGSRYNADRAWCALNDLADLRLVARHQGGNNAQAYAINADGLQVLAACAAASAHYNTACWACPIDSVAYSAATSQAVGPWPLQTAAPADTDTTGNPETPAPQAVTVDGGTTTTAETPAETANTGNPAPETPAPAVVRAGRTPRKPRG